MLLLAMSFSLEPVARASMGHALGHSRVLTAAVWFCMILLAMPLRAALASRASMGHGLDYSRMLIAAVWSRFTKLALVRFFLRSPNRLQFLYLLGRGCWFLAFYRLPTKVTQLLQ